MRLELFQLHGEGERETSKLLSVSNEDEEDEMEGPSEERRSPSRMKPSDLYLSQHLPNSSSPTPNPLLLPSSCSSSSLPDLHSSTPTYLSTIFETVRNNPALACLLLHSIPDNLSFLSSSSPPHHSGNSRFHH